MIEEWRLCFGGNYAVSNLGRVRRETARRGARVGRIRKLLLGHGGYLIAVLWLDGKATQATVHSLVAEAFIGPRPEGKQVNHRNAVKTDNCPENLEYVTRAEQMEHACRLGLNPLAKLNPDSVREIRERRKRGTKRRILAAEYGVNLSTIDRALKGGTWAHVPERAA